MDSIKKDVIKKTRGMKVTEQVYIAIIQMLKLSRAAGKEGVFAMEFDVLDNGKLEPELDDITILPMAIRCVCGGMDPEWFREIMDTKYWVKDPQGMEALVYYICMDGISMIGVGMPEHFLERLLTALLPDECMPEYERLKEERMPQQTMEEIIEEFIEEEPHIPRRCMIIRNVLEEKINQATESSIQKLVGSDIVDAFDIAIVMRGLNKTSKKKIFSCMSPGRREVIWKKVNSLFLESQGDFEAGMVKFLECFEKTEQENAAS
ncbi:MAG TPA: hypothetical protein DDY31_19085 [Lachnospiraceae bacterium]|nr:hypothetical protein [Lachnospiraceae bacterium]